MVHTRQAERSRAVSRVLWIVLGLNLAVAATKLTVGYAIGALALMADGIHSSLDASSNVVGLIGITLASRPPDRGHPYGHQRFETLAALIIGLLIGASALEIARHIVQGVRGQTAPPEVTVWAAAVVVFTIVVNVGISRYESRRGRELKSSLLEADAQHTKSDAFAAGAVLVGFGGVALGYGWADAVGAAIVLVFIARTAWNVLKANFTALADSAMLDPGQVHAVALAVPGVKGAHHIRSRGSTDTVYLDLHIHLDPSLELTAAHAKTHEVVKALHAAFPEVTDVVIHTEPADGREHDPSRLAPGVSTSIPSGHP